MYENAEKFLRDTTLLFLKKDKDYGNSFGNSLDKYGKVAFQVRAEDKINRFKNLREVKAGQVEDEALIDTVIDLFNYIIMFSAWEKGDGVIKLTTYVDIFYTSVTSICENKIPECVLNELEELGLDYELIREITLLIAKYMNKYDK